MVSHQYCITPSDNKRKLTCTLCRCAAFHSCSFLPSHSICNRLMNTAQLSAKDRISASTGGGSSSSNANDMDADKYFAPLQAACESRQPRLMEIALDGIHYLIGHRN